MKVFSETPATIVALLVLVAMTAWFLHWVLNKWKIGERDKKITGLEVEIRILERQKADLEIRLKEALEQKLPTALLPTEKPRLQFEFSEAWIERPAPNLWIATVRVKNPTASTILGAFVCIEAIRKIEGINQQDLPHFRKLPLLLRDDRGIPPHDNIDLHPSDEAIFNLVTLQQPASEQYRPETLLHHTRGYAENKGYWVQRPSGALEPGRYCVQLKAQGRDVPAETFSIEFENIPDSIWVRQVK